MGWFEAVLLGIVEGLTEFLPVSSTGHLTITEKLLGMDIADRGVTAFTAIIQVGAIAAAVLFFWSDIVRLATGWFAGILDKDKRGTDYRLGWGVIVGSIPIAVVGLVFKDVIEGVLRSLWVVVGALIVWSLVMWIADRADARNPSPRGEETMTVIDALVIGLVQCVALIPGVSRSGATISTGLLRGIDRVTATRWSFFLGIPALTASGILQAATSASDVSHTVGWGPTILGTVVSFGVAYVTIAWLLRFVQSNRFTAFIVYRIAVGVLIAALLVAGVVAAV